VSTTAPSKFLFGYYPWEWEECPTWLGFYPSLGGGASTLNVPTFKRSNVPTLQGGSRPIVLAVSTLNVPTFITQSLPPTFMPEGRTPVLLEGCGSFGTGFYLDLLWYYESHVGEKLYMPYAYRSILAGSGIHGDPSVRSHVDLDP
jgi:hypothetical protein